MHWNPLCVMNTQSYDTLHNSYQIMNCILRFDPAYLYVHNKVNKTRIFLYQNYSIPIPCY